MDKRTEKFKFPTSVMVAISSPAERVRERLDSWARGFQWGPGLNNGQSKEGTSKGVDNAIQGKGG